MISQNLAWYPSASRDHYGKVDIDFSTDVSQRVVIGNAIYDGSVKPHANYVMIDNLTNSTPVTFLATPVSLYVPQYSRLTFRLPKDVEKIDLNGSTGTCKIMVSAEKVAEDILNEPAISGVVVPRGGGATVVYVAKGIKGDGVGNVTPGLPGGLVAGDILILVIEGNGASVVSLPAGYAHVTGSPVVSGPASLLGTTLGVAWKRAVGGEAAPTVIDWGDHTLAYLMSFRNCIATGDPTEGGISGTDPLGAAGSVSVAGITLTNTGEMIVMAASIADDKGGFSAWDAGLGIPTVRIDQPNTTGDDGHLAAATYSASVSGATGVISATETISGDSTALIAFALKGA